MSVLMGGSRLCRQLCPPHINNRPASKLCPELTLERHYDGELNPLVSQWLSDMLECTLSVEITAEIIKLSQSANES